MLPKKKKVSSKKKQRVSKSKTSIQINLDEKGLMVIDQKKIRKKALSECQKTLKKIDKVNLEFKQFESQDKPAYDRWIQQNFGEIINRIKADSLEIQEKRHLIDEVQESAFHKRITFIEAYKLIMIQRANRDRFTKSEEDAKGEEEFWQNDEEGDEDDVFREDLNDFFRKYNASKEEFESFKKRFKEGTLRKEGSFDSRLKERYRLLAQKLHPDKNRNASPVEKDLWYEAHDAYLKKDLEKLDFIVALFNVRFGHVGIDSSIFDLRSANSKLLKKLKEITNQVKRAKNEPSWSFLKLSSKKLNSLKSEASKEFKEFEKNTSTELKEINNILMKWEKGANNLANKEIDKKKSSKEDDFINFYAHF